MKKVSDYIVEFLIEKKVTDIFGYPGGMVTHLMESLSKYEDKINTHINYHEQASSFAACGYAQAKGEVGVAFATSGPGATNLITGICNAYFDSIPCVFITGQVNTTEKNKENLGRQKGFQETDITSIVKPITKYCKYIENAEDIKYYLEKAWNIAKNDRPGPVLLDIPMNIFRSEINEENLKSYNLSRTIESLDLKKVFNMINNAERPCILVGNGIKIANCVNEFSSLVKMLNIPVVSSMLAVDILSKDNPLNYGFIGAYGDRKANFIVAKSDLIISFGSRMDIRQVGGKIENFAPNAKLIRFDIDDGELNNKIKIDQVNIKGDLKNIVLSMLKDYKINKNYSSWIGVCNTISESLAQYDKNPIENLIKKISAIIPNNTIITTDVGQNQVWIAQYFQFKDNQKILFSGGHGAMGYSLPAAIGAYYATQRPVVCFSGDGGIQMNIQELQFVKENNIPIYIFIFNNHALGMIRHFQEMYFDNNYAGTVEKKGYSTPNFKLLANAYNLHYDKINCDSNINLDILNDYPKIIEIDINEKTYVFPKLEFGKPNQDQEPLIERELYKKLMDL